MENSNHFDGSSTAAHEPTTNGIIPDAFGNPYTIENSVVVGPAKTSPDANQGSEITAEQDPQQSPEQRRADASTAAGVIATETTVAIINTRPRTQRGWDEVGRTYGAASQYAGGIGYPPGAY